MNQHLSSDISILYKDFIEFCNAGLAKMELTQGLLYFILYIGKHPNCSPSALSATLHLDTGYTTRSLEKLIASGFILKEKNHRDKRSSLLKLTPYGEEAFSYSRNLVAEWELQALADLSEEEISDLFSALKKIKQKKESCYDKRS